MKSKPNVRGGGQNRSKIKTLEKEVADQNEIITRQSAIIDKQDAALGEAIEKAQILADALQAKDKLKRASHGAKPKYDIPERLIRPTANLMFREEGRRDPETFEMIRGAREANQGLEPEASAKGHAAKAANLVGGESKLQDPNGPFAYASGSKQIPPEPVIDFEVTDELVAEWVKWQTSQGKHIPPHHAPVMAALQRAGQDSVQLPPKIAELTERVIKTVEAQRDQQSSPQAPKAELSAVESAGM